MCSFCGGLREGREKNCGVYSNVYKHLYIELGLLALENVFSFRFLLNPGFFFFFFFPPTREHTWFSWVHCLLLGLLFTRAPPSCPQAEPLKKGKWEKENVFASAGLLNLLGYRSVVLNFVSVDDLSSL